MEKVEFIIDEDLMDYDIKKEVKEIKKQLSSLYEKIGKIGVKDFLNDLQHSLQFDLNELRERRKKHGKN